MFKLGVVVPKTKKQFDKSQHAIQLFSILYKNNLTIANAQHHSRTQMQRLECVPQKKFEKKSPDC